MSGFRWSEVRIFFSDYYFMWVNYSKNLFENYKQTDLFSQSDVNKAANGALDTS